MNDREDGFSIDSYLTALKHTDPKVRQLMIDKLGELGDSAAIDALKNIVQEDADTQVRLRAIVSLTKLGGESATPFLISTLLHDENNEVRRECINAVAFLRDSSASAVLVSVLDDEDPAIRESSLFALGRMKAQHVTDTIIGVLEKDEEPEIRSKAAYALGEIGAVNVVERLIATLDREEEPSVKQDIIFSLGRLGDRRAAKPVAFQLEKMDAKYHFWIFWALGKLRVKPVIPTLLYILNITSSPLRRRLVAEALGDLGASQAVEPLIDLLDSEYANVRGGAIIALGKIQDERAIPAIERTATGYKGEVSVYGLIEELAQEAILSIQRKD